MKTILLLAYKFHPYPRVGANTWNNLSVALCNLGYAVHVITVDWPPNPQSRLPDMGEQYLGNLLVHRIKANYPIGLLHGEHGLFLQFIAKVWNRIFGTLFYWDDMTQHWKKSMLRKAEELIAKHNIKLVIATGHPFRVTYFAAILKKKLPDIILIQHFQDPWAQDEDRKLSPAKKRKQLKLQRYSIENADLCLSVTRGLATLMSEGFARGTWDILPNGYNPHSLPFVSAPPKPEPKNHTVFTYIGNIACGRFELFEKFVVALRPYHLHAKLVYVGMHSELVRQSFTADIKNGLIEIHPLLPQKEALQIVASGDWALQLNSEIYPYLVSTKIYEYGMLKKPTLSINYGGEIESLIQENSLGISINLKSQNLNTELQRLMENKFDDSFAFNISSYSYENIAYNLSRKLEQWMGYEIANEYRATTKP